METLQAFWAEVINVWQMEVYGLQIDRLVTAVGLLLVFVLLRRLIAHFIVGFLKRLVSKTKSQFDDLALDALEQPLTFAPLAFGFFMAAQILGIDGDAANALNRFVRTLIAIMIFWGLMRLIDPLAYLLKPMERAFSPTLVSWVRKGLRGLFFFMAVIAVLTIWGIPVMPVLASFSLLSVAVALGAQDFFKNLIGGMLIIAEKRFRMGDWILVDGVVEGTVEKVDFRSTAVRRFDKALVNVPNATLSDRAVTNFSRMTHRRIYWKIGIEYSAKAAQLREIRDNLERYILESDDFAHPPEVSTFVRIDAFNASSIDIMLYCFTKTTDWGTWLEIKEQLALKIKDIVEAAGTDFAFPSQTIYVEQSEGQSDLALAPATPMAHS